MHVSGSLQLLTQFRSHVREAKSPASLAMTIAGNFFAFVVTAAHGFERYRNADRLAVPQNFQLDRRPGLLLSYLDLKLAGVADFLSVQFGDDVADFQTSFRRRRSVFDLAGDGSFIVVHVEELGILRRHIADADSHVSVSDFTVADESVHRGADDLSGNRETHPGKAIRVRDQEGVDADHFAASVDQR